MGDLVILPHPDACDPGDPLGHWDHLDFLPLLAYLEGKQAGVASAPDHYCQLVYVHYTQYFPHPNFDVV